MALEATYKTKNGRLVVKFTGDTVKSLFVEYAQVVEILDTEEKCGKCGSVDIIPRVRITDFTYHEMYCRACHATFGFGVKKSAEGKEGPLYPKRQDKKKNWLPNGGWKVYQAGQQDDDEPEQHERPGQPEQRRTQQQPNKGERAW